MEDKEIIELDQELVRYNDTPFHIRCDDVMNEISVAFKNLGFIDKYQEYCKNKITKNDLNIYIKDVLLILDEYTRHDLNHMCAMLSTKNCWCGEYSVGELVHEQLLKIWYPEDYK